ncbi:hypothetical protein M7I_1630 [Glarea lozoyensis 74030]|uniref:Uncharacterized protein n=1 Tax=Glarea lozoyensis (strain ATCC 74030 / MF5533) TaxID=1104152 RepID=H0EGL3_GLAL7|nr:hypothetical protein M7I_1630 [Glarea lozoyensis 74030]
MSASLWKELVTLDGTHFADHFAIAYLAVSIVAVVGILYALSSSSSKSICYKGNDASLRKKAYDLLILSMLFYLLVFRKTRQGEFGHDSMKAQQTPA